TIVLKCLEKAPSRRYLSAEALAEDLENWLAARPIRARRATVPERLFKWARREPEMSALVALVVVLTAMLCGLALVGTFVLRAQSAKVQRARLEAQRRLAQALEQKQRSLDEERYFPQVLAAQQALADRAFDRAEQLLKECPPSMRNWEWRHLN